MKLPQAETLIATILADIEREYDADVEGIDIRDIEDTRMDDPRRHIQRHITIELKRRPGQQWAQAGTEL